jgi:hypothetical protein
LNTTTNTTTKPNSESVFDQNLFEAEVATPQPEKITVAVNHAAKVVQLRHMWQAGLAIFVAGMLASPLASAVLASVFGGGK